MQIKRALRSAWVFLAKTFLVSVFNYTVFSDESVKFTKINILRGRGLDKTRCGGFDRAFD
jgi:hypothetical protein